MKNIQSYIIAGMTITIVVLCWFLYSVNSTVYIYKKEIELQKLNKYKEISIKKIDSEIKDLSKLSTETVEKANSIIKNIKHETPIVKDTTDTYMYEYIVNYSPTGQR